MIDRLNVTLAFDDSSHATPIGQLGRDPTRRGFAFEWDSEFANSPLLIWPVKARRMVGLLRGARGLPGVFEDSLPDGWGRLLLDREIRATGASTTELDDMQRLAFVGCHGMGALTYRPSTTPAERSDIDLGWFEHNVARIEEISDIDVLQRLRALSGGSQGARPKFMAQIAEDGVTLRDHRCSWEQGWTPVLIKGRGSMDAKGSIEVELAYGEMMRVAGITSRPMFALEGKQERFFGTQRFDREAGRRVHMASVAGLLDTGLQHGVFDYLELMRLAKGICRNKADTAEELFRRMVFNVRAISRDDHIRNHAFLMDMSGSWQLAPAFDVTFDLGPGGEHSMAIAGEGRFPGRAAFSKVAEVGGIRAKRRDEIIDAVDAALSCWPEMAAKHQVPERLLQDIYSKMAEARGWE
ncbi:serine/threonine-protein kinase HipA [Epibacterium ulvae]|uniref:Serine/threonine-protein kinase HipA n=1 Tax=Epibacterium ulvae TaxID=1156985 RepID=A0A1G5QFF9_9RHOB|nr:type II toxin-antitoxin system HipA family toxin [Epibacterium ulvae]SCZ60412.1 serine/threonine-protein kinase HipA [Epibacterium ulvae]